MNRRSLLTALLVTAVPTGASAQNEWYRKGSDWDTFTLADFALQYLGYPYVWAGNTPSGFDCSGFTQYCVWMIKGYDITHSVPIQFGYGAWVDWGEWQEGDLIFFANTYDVGLSHVGIYIGEGNFIHAENPSTGVRISSVYSEYYSWHYAGARRL